MDWTRQINNYCERLGPEFWAEPVNAITNGAFFVSAAIAFVIGWRSGRLDGPVLWLIGVLSAIGLGSFLFHTYAQVWSAIADTTPIALFILSYFAIAMNRFVGLGWGMAALATVGFLVALAVTSAGLRPLLLPLIGGSVGYVPALLGLLAVGAWLRLLKREAATWLFAAAGVFTVSLTFRTLDMPYCEYLPFGLHFLWHILNAVVLGVLLIAVIRHGRAPSPPAPANSF